MDVALFEQINGAAGRWDWLDLLMTVLSSYGFILAFVIIVLLLFTQKRGPAWLSLLSLAAALGLNYLIKMLVNRPQPFVTRDASVLMEQSASPSFPSDQAVIMGVCLALFFCIGRQAGWMALFPVLLVLVSRVYTGHHYPLDVLSGALLGALVMGTAVWIRKKRSRRSRFTPSYSRHFP
ncbi:phosphatase PAP2 family protein [Salibacterium sp. K-3]